MPEVEGSKVSHPLFLKQLIFEYCFISISLLWHIFSSVIGRTISLK